MSHHAAPQPVAAGLAAGFRALQRIAVAVRSRVDPRPVLDGLVADAGRLLDLRLCALALGGDADPAMLVAHEYRSSPSEVHPLLGRRLDPEGDMADAALRRPLFQDHRPVVWPGEAAGRVAECPAILTGLEGAAMAVVPVVAEHRTIGLLIAARASDAGWHEAEVEFLHAAADLAAAALQHAFTRHQLGVLCSFPSELQARAEASVLLRRLVEAGMQVTRATGGLAGLREGDLLVSRERRVKDAWAPLELRFSRGQGLVGWCWVNRVPCVSSDAPHDPRADVELKRRLGVITAMTVPIVDHAGDVIGFIELHDKPGGVPFTDEDIRLGRCLTHQAALALQAELHSGA